VVPLEKDSAELSEIPEPTSADGSVLVQAVATGVCGTDREIVEGAYGAPPPGRDRLVLGHESLGRVMEAPPGSGIGQGDLVAGIVRHPDPVPCPNCAVGEWDMCRNGRYTEHGIKGRDGFMAERWRESPDHVVAVDAGLGIAGVLMEPTSVVAKAWEHVDRIGARARWEPRSALITGAGPIGLLAALLGAQRGLEVHVVDRNTEGPKPALVRDLGATHHPDLGDAPTVDVAIDATGAGRVIAGVLERVARNGVLCLTGIGGGGTLELPAELLTRDLVLRNVAVFGSVNANRRHWQQAADALAGADRRWLERLVTRRVPVDRWAEALERRDDDVKAVIEFEE
jgi:threonine dehydrogenase-like Zn-dependent dehydrogenase